MEACEEINRLKEKRNAIILAHNYQLPEVQDIADFIGDSLGLAKQATKTEADVIIFCGVEFMAESVKILNPDKIVIHPDRTACCPMAAMVSPEKLEATKKAHPDACVVSYVNTTAAVKALSDICCTSANAIKVIKNLPTQEIIFVPDTNLGLYVQRFIKDKKFFFWPGYCYVHKNIRKDQILTLKEHHPVAEVLVHPECMPEVIDLADFVYSTSDMVKHVKESTKAEFIVGTETGLIYRMKKESGKTFYPLPDAVCSDMKKITLKKVLESLEKLEPEIHLSQNIIEKAKAPLDRMMEISRGD